MAHSMKTDFECECNLKYAILNGDCDCVYCNKKYVMKTGVQGLKRRK